jgi:alpha-galactosidase
MVGNRSQLYINHPDWVVKDRLDGGPLVQMQFYGEFRWHKRSEEYYILDVTHPDALDYLRNVFTTWHSKWGCEYFKTDFMFFGSEYGPDRAIYHTPGKTRIEVWRLAAEMIRDAIGDAVWSGCGCPLWASIGLVDAIRVGKDMGVSWRGERSALSLLNDQANRNFGNHILWQIDPDAILLRNRFHHLSDIEIRSLAIYAGMTGGVVMTSDSLDELSHDRIQLFDLLLSTEKAKCSYPFLGKMLPDDASNQLDPVLVQVHQNLDNQADYSSIFIFNSGDTMAERVYRLSELGFKSGQYLFDWISEKPLSGKIDSLKISLQPHDGILYFAAEKPFNQTPRKLS